LEHGVDVAMAAWVTEIILLQLLCGYALLVSRIR